MWAACRLSHIHHLLHLLQALKGEGSILSTLKDWEESRGRRELLDALFGTPVEVTFADQKVMYDIKESFLSWDAGLGDLMSVLPRLPHIEELKGVDNSECG